ncbi:hypothetical protein ACE1ET_12710 [Saccharicrinis sp. FJH62]|uniref:hypothetical protein n=1 Tax=Saccharicrinis sp. FJH62 TaxID=3344657 RepID=UPI0035D503FC
MKQIIFVLALIALVSCEKKTEKTCPTARVMATTCAGSVLQFIGENEPFGEAWINIFESPGITYSNCALAENLPTDFHKGDTLNLNYIQVSRFTTAGLCTLDSLPKTKIRITEILDGDCN